MTEGTPISYEGLARGTAVVSNSGTRRNASRASSDSTRRQPFTVLRPKPSTAMAGSSQAVCATASTFRPSRVTVTNAGAAGKSRSHKS